MSTDTRIIARLDIKGERLVKGVQLEGIRALGEPKAFAKQYYEAGIDELIYLDVVASLYGRNSLLEFVRATAECLFVPLAVGGGLRTLQDIRDALNSGADKVALNTAAVHNPDLISEAASCFGSSTIVISIEAKKRKDHTYEVYVDGGREPTGRDPVAWARQAAEAGAGEILLTSIDRDGTGLGFDCPLTREIADLVSIPVIASGGAGSVSDVLEVITAGHADAVAVASMLHYGLLGTAPPWKARSRPSQSTASVGEIRAALSGGVPAGANID